MAIMRFSRLLSELLELPHGHVWVRVRVRIRVRVSVRVRVRFTRVTS